MSSVNVYHFFVCPSFPFGFVGGIWDLVVLIPDHCLSIYFRPAWSDVLLDQAKYVVRCL